MKRILGWIAFAIVVILITVYFTLLRTTAAPEDCTFTLDLTSARALANSLPGPKPSEIREEHLLDIKFPEAVVSTGQSWRMTDMSVYAYELLFPDGSHIILDTAMDDKQSQTADGRNFDTAAWGRLARAMLSASAIYITHEHTDHVGGLFSSDAMAPAWPHAHLTPEQLAPQSGIAPFVISQEARAALVPLQYAQQTAVAPGVVLIKAPGHTPGSQLFFITREDGTELLLLGDNAWHMVNIDTMRGPPRLMAMVLKADGHAVACELAAFHQARATDPKVYQMPGHDAKQMQALIDAGVIKQGFR